MIKTISTLLPRLYPKELLETQYSWMNHTSNSPLIEDHDAHDEETVKDKLEAKKKGVEYVEEHHV